MASAVKKCGKCDKTVYPTEEIRCLDKSWHKGCFKCTTCGTTLNIKNARGYEKLPYCSVHYPQLKATVVVDNPEMKRIRELTDIQSNASYHKDFNENKGKVTAVTDDIATIRAKEQQRNVSQVEYARKNSTSQNLAPDDHEQLNETTTTVNENTETSKPTIGRVIDYDPLNNNRGSLSRGYEPTFRVLHATKFAVNEPTISKLVIPITENQFASAIPQDEVKVEPPPPIDDIRQDEVKVESSPSDDIHQNETRETKTRFRAMYAYQATEPDELTFEEGDFIIECVSVDDGWMRGQLETSGIVGLLPSNYVEIVPQE